MTSESKWKLVPVEPTEEMVEAHFKAHAEAKTVFAEVPDIWRAMLAASPQPPAPGAEVVARVKPLVWRDLIKGRYWTAATPFGELAIQPYPNGYFATLNDADIGISGATPDAVKSAVEADHCRRILSALEPTQPTAEEIARRARERLPAMIEAAARAFCHSPMQPQNQEYEDANWRRFAEPARIAVVAALAALAKPPGETGAADA